MTFHWEVLYQHAGSLVQGAELTVLLTVVTMLIALPGGALLALMRISPIAPLRWISTCFVEFFRNVPIILLVYWTFYVLPVLSGVTFSPFATALTALAMNVSAYNSETFRAGINSIRKGQREAALCLGMSEAQAMWKVVMPQAVKRILPILASTWVSLFKDTSLVSVIAVGELAYTAMELRSQTFRALEFLTAMAVIYWALGYPQAKLVDWIDRKWGVIE
jgi:polar amino acid transport system permease protein